MMGALATINVNGQVKLWPCASCGRPVALTDEHERRLREDGSKFYCPAGHVQVFKTTDSDRLRAMLADANRRNTALAGEVQQQADQRRKAERALAQHKRRAKAGTCPCCKRTFVQLARHMTAKHPDYAT